MKIAAPISMLTVLLASFLAATASASEACPAGQTRVVGAVDEAVFARVASRGIRAEWCEQYDVFGQAERIGAYTERYPNGARRTRAEYVDGRLSGPVLAYHENGEIFLRGTLRQGAWHGPVALHHENGARFWVGEYVEGRLDGRIELRHPDGGLAAETRFQAGREDGRARSFYPLVLGGGLRSEVHVEADRLVGLHRVFDAEGNELERARRAKGPRAWSATPPVAAPVPSAPADAKPTAGD